MYSNRRLVRTAESVRCFVGGKLLSDERGDFYTKCHKTAGSSRQLVAAVTGPNIGERGVEDSVNMQVTFA